MGMEEKKEDINGDGKSFLLLGKIAKVAIVIVMCIVVNYAGKFIGEKYALPLWMDSLGTVVAAYITGPIGGAFAGFTANVLYGKVSPESFAYGITSICIGISVGLMARKRWFDTFLNTVMAIFVVVALAMAVSVPLNFSLYDGGTGNVWGDGVMNYLEDRGIGHYIAAVIGEFYIDFVDKTITLVLLFVLVHLRNTIKRGIKYGNAYRMLMFTGAVLFFGSIITSPVQCSADIKDEEDISYIQTVYNSDSGLPCGNANDIAQTKDGILWIGTYAGLFRYSGGEFKLMHEYNSVRNVNCMYVDSEDRIWVGTNDSGVVVIKDEKIVGEVSGKDGLQSDSIRSIIQSSDGYYYVGTSDGMAVVSFDKEIVIEATIDEVNYAYDITANTKGYVAAITYEGGLYVLKNKKVVDTYTLSEKDGKYTSVLFENDNVIYMGTSEGVLIKGSFNAGTIKTAQKIPCADYVMVNRICKKDNGTIYVCTDNGIGYLKDDGSFAKTETGTFNRSIQNMETDYQGNLWFASSRHGLLKMTLSPFEDLYSEAGIEEKVVNATALWNGLLYVGTDVGIDIINLSDKTHIENELTKSLEGVRIRCVMADSQDHLWICTYGMGLIEVDKEGNKKSYNLMAEGVGNRVRVCMELSDGSVVVGSDNGLTFIKDDKVTGHIPFGDDIGFAQILSLLELSDGRLLVGTDGNGIIVIKDKKVVKKITSEDGLTSGVILRMVADSDRNNVFVVTSNSLCYMDDGKANIMSNFPYYNNYDVYLDDDGEMFVLGSAGCYVIDKEELLSHQDPDYRILNSKMGLAGALTANAWHTVDENKNMYLCTEKGVFIVNADKYVLDSEIYKVNISSIEIDGNLYNKNSENANAVIKLSRETSKIEIVPEVVNYTKEDPMVTYYLEGLEESTRTMHASELSSVVYTNLDPGQYVFHLLIESSDTGADIDEEIISFEKEKAIYDNKGFLVYLIFVGSLFVIMVSWLVTTKYNEEKLSYAMKQIEMGNQTILAIAKTVDAKDVRTSKHSQRVSMYSVLIAKELGFTKDELENLRKAALLHDIGKIGIPDSILNKPGRLTDEEYAIMKTHVTRGAEILKDFTIVDHVVEGARYHHERYDGKGYPDGLKGEEIPLYGRIIAVADAFDAMTANRVYRNKIPFEQVLEELRRCSGSQFDPQFAGIFLKLIENGTIDVDALYSDVKESTESNEETKKDEDNKEDGKK